MNTNLKRILSMVLCIAMLVSSTVIAATAESTVNPSIRVEDTDGSAGYAAVSDEVGAVIAENGGATVVMDICVESFTAPTEGMFSQIAAFTGGGTAEAKYNLLSYDFTAKTFKAGQTNEWITNAPASDYVEVASNPFNWETGKWYELAFRFNGSKAAIYLNGICVISTAFDAAAVDYLIVYPQFCTAKFDNIRICAKDYDVANGTGKIIATENFNSLSDAADSSVWTTYDYTIEKYGCDRILTTTKDNCIRINAADNTSGYSAAKDAYNDMVVTDNGVTLIADVYLNAVHNAPEGFTSRLIAFTGAYSDVDRYNYAGIDFGANDLVVMESEAWLYDADSSLTNTVASEDFEWSAGEWYEMAWQFNGNNVALYVDGTKMLTGTVSSVDSSYIILYAQYCDVKIDNIRLCDKNYNVASGVGTVWAVEDYRNAVSYDTSDVWSVDPAYTLDTNGADVFVAGDVNGDFVIDMNDYTNLSRILNGASIKVSAGADVNLDGSVNLNDFTLLGRIINGYNYVADVTLSVTPVEKDDSAIVEEEPETPVEPPVTEESSVTETEAPEVPVESTDNVIAKIDAIGKVTYKSLSLITDAEAAYDRLTRTQKSEVTNYSVLTEARSTYDVLHAEVVAYKAAVSELPATATNTEACAKAIAKCAIAYSTLTSPGQIDAVLTEKAKYDALRAEWEAVVASETYEKAIAKIDAIGKVTYNSLPLITEAESVYEGLTDAQKSKVTNYSVLVEARSTYDALHAEVVAYKAAVAELPEIATATDACTKAIAKCAIAYSTLTSPGQIDAVRTEKAKYDIFRAEWEVAVALENAHEVVIAKINDIGQVTYNSYGAIVAAETAYESLTDAQKSKVTNYSVLTEARSTYDALHAEVVTYKETVAALPEEATATDECTKAIANCAIAYSTLTSPGQIDAVLEEKAKYDAFRAQWEAAKAYEVAHEGVMAKIDAIGQVTYKSLSLITDAENAYNALDSNQRSKVTNYSVLTEAKSAYDALHAEVVAYKAAVAELPEKATATDECAKAIAKCAIAYSTLTSPGQIDAVLTEKAKYDAFRAQWEAAKAYEEAPGVVMAKIDAIGKVTYNSLSLITDAEAAYRSLDSNQKSKVTNYSVLTEARSTYDALHAEVVAYKNAVAELPAIATATEECKKAIAKCAIAYATLTSPGQVDAVKTEKAKYDALRAAWEKAVANDGAIDMGSGSGDRSGIDGSALKFNAFEGQSYSMLFSDQPQSYSDMALTFDVMIESINTNEDFAGLGVWNGNGDDGRNFFVGYDFKDQRFTNAGNTVFPNTPSADSNIMMSLQTGEWNHFCFRRLNNNTFEVYVNGKLCYTVTGQDYSNTYFIFAFRNVVAYVDNYQYYHAGTPCGLVTDFTTGATTDSSGHTRFADGGYWVVHETGYAGVVKGQSGFDGSSLKFDGNSAASYTLVLNEGPISNNDIALTFDVFVDSIDSSANFAGLGVWNGNNTFVGYDFKDQKFVGAGCGYPYVPDSDNGLSLKLNVGEWNHFNFRRINNNTFIIYVNGVKYLEMTGQSYANTYMIFGFRNCVAHIDNYQAYENGAGKGLYTDFSGFTNNGGNLISPDGGYWIIGSQGFAGIDTTKTGGVTGSGVAGTNLVPGSGATDGNGAIVTTTTTTPAPTQPPVTQPSGGGGVGDLGVSVDWSVRKVSSGWELANRCVAIATNYKTLYVMGCFGAPMSASNKTRYTTNHSYNKQASRKAMIMAASSDTFGFDCVCLVKGVLWGWNGSLNSSYGGASYTSNGVYDFGTDALDPLVGNKRSKDWNNIQIGEILWLSGHYGVYIGNGLGVECTPAWENKVQITAVGNIGSKAGYKTRTWSAHAKLKYVAY